MIGLMLQFCQSWRGGWPCPNRSGPLRLMLTKTRARGHIRLTILPQLSPLQLQPQPQPHSHHTTLQPRTHTSHCPTVPTGPQNTSTTAQPDPPPFPASPPPPARLRYGAVRVMRTCVSLMIGVTRGGPTSGANLTGEPMFRTTGERYRLAVCGPRETGRLPWSTGQC